MKNRGLNFVLAIAVLAGAAIAQSPPRTYELPTVTTPPVLDGFRSPGEWDHALKFECSPSQVLRDGLLFGWRNQANLESEVSANQLAQSAGEDPAVARTDADYSATIWQGWDDEALYYIAEVRDNTRDVVGSGSLTSWWERDSMSLYVDLNDEDTGSGDIPGTTTGLNIINFVAAPQNSGPATITLETTVQHERQAHIESAHTAGLEYVFRDAGDEFGGEADYVIEGKIPWAALVREGNLNAVPGMGSEMGFSWLPVDPDGDEAYGGQLQCVSMAGGPVAEFADWRFAGPTHVVTAPPYPIHELTDADVAAINLRDGSIAEWQNILGAPSLTPADFTVDPTLGEAAPYNPADLDYRIWLGWHPGSGRLYMAIERVDNVYINTYPGGNLGDLWSYDSIEFMVDGDHSGGDYTGSADPNWTVDEQTLNNNRTAQQYVAIADAPDDRKVGYLGAGNDWVTLPPFGDGGGGSTGTNPTTSAIEFYVTPFDNLIFNNPGASLPSQLFTDKIIGFQISVPDFDTVPQEYHAFHTLSGQAETWRYADRFADGRLLSDKTNTPPPSEPPSPRLQVVIPNGGETWSERPINNIYWFADASLPRVSIDYSLDGGTSWRVITPSTVNDGVYEWAGPPDVTSVALIRIADAADGDPVDISDAVFSLAIPDSFPPQISSWQKRSAIFPGEPLNLYASVNSTAAIVAVYTEIRKDGTLVATVSLADDGVSPDESAGDGVYSGQWAGTDQVGPYTWGVFAENSLGSIAFSGDGWFRVAHTIVSIPENALRSPEALAVARMPVFIEDDGSGYLSRGFLSANFDIGLWKESGDTPPPGTLGGISFTGTALASDRPLVETLEQANGNSTLVHVGLASSHLLHVSAGPGPAQEAMAYIDVNWDPADQNQVSLRTFMNVPTAMFDEDIEVAPTCCGSLAVGRGDVDGNQAINSFDASLVLLHTVRKLNLNEPDNAINDAIEATYGFIFRNSSAYSADVSGVGGISALDAAYILQHDVDLITHFPAEEGYYRLWEPPSTWWNPPTNLATAKAVALAAAPKLHRTVRLGEPAASGEQVVVPVEIDQMQGVLAGELTLHFPAQGWQVAGVRKGGLTAEYLLAHHAVGEELRVAFAGASAPEGGGKLFEVVLDRVERGSQGGTVALSEVRLNEGEAETAIESPTAGKVLDLPGAFGLQANYPNPFNPSTTVGYALPVGSAVDLVIYDLAGQRVRLLQAGWQEAGRHQLEWDGRDELGREVASGVYLYKLVTPQQTLVRKMTLLR